MSTTSKITWATFSAGAIATGRWALFGATVGTTAYAVGSTMGAAGVREEANKEVQAVQHEAEARIHAAQVQADEARHQAEEAERQYRHGLEVAQAQAAEDHAHARQLMEQMRESQHAVAVNTPGGFLGEIENLVVDLAILGVVCLGIYFAYTHSEFAKNRKRMREQRLRMA